MRRLALIICIFGSNIQNLTKLCMTINIGYSVILDFKIFYLKVQTNVAYLEMCDKTPLSNKLFFDINLRN